jgi:hypothetical protein
MSIEEQSMSMSIEEQSMSTSPRRIERKLAAIFSADVKGYSRLMGEDEVAEILRISPQYSLEVVRQRIPYKDLVSLEHQVAALRKAGLK